MQKLRKLSALFALICAISFIFEGCAAEETLSEERKEELLSTTVQMLWERNAPLNVLKNHSSIICETVVEDGMGREMERSVTRCKMQDGSLLLDCVTYDADGEVNSDACAYRDENTDGAVYESADVYQTAIISPYDGYNECAAKQYVLTAQMANDEVSECDVKDGKLIVVTKQQIDEDTEKEIEYTVNADTLLIEKESVTYRGMFNKKLYQQETTFTFDEDFELDTTAMDRVTNAINPCTITLVTDGGTMTYTVVKNAKVIFDNVGGEYHLYSDAAGQNEVSFINVDYDTDEILLYMRR